MVEGAMAAVVVSATATVSVPSVEVEARLSISFSLVGGIVVIRRRDVYAAWSNKENEFT